jgi:hypothetical protein
MKHCLLTQPIPRPQRFWAVCREELWLCHRTSSGTRRNRWVCLQRHCRNHANPRSEASRRSRPLILFPRSHRSPRRYQSRGLSLDEMITDKDLRIRRIEERTHTFDLTRSASWLNWISANQDKQPRPLFRTDGPHPDYSSCWEYVFMAKVDSCWVVQSRVEKGLQRLPRKMLISI